MVKQNVQCSKENAPQLHKNDNTLVHNTSNSDTESSDSMVWIDGQLVTKSSCLNYESETDSTNSTRTEQRHSKRSLSDSALADGAVVVSLDSIPLLEKSNTSASEALALKMESFRNTKQRNGWNRRVSIKFFDLLNA